MTGGLTTAEETTLVDLLEKVDQPYSRRLTEALLGCIPALAVELVILRRHNGIVYVLLTQRPDELHYPWAGAWNCPGSVARVTDVDGIPAIIKRLEEDELGCRLSSIRLVYGAATQNLGGRKLTFQFVHLAQVEPGAETLGKWYAVDNLPSGLPEQHISMIHRVIEHF